MKKIYLKKCPIRYMHDFDDYPCPKCNGIILEDLWFQRKYRIILGVIMVIIGWLMVLTG